MDAEARMGRVVQRIHCDGRSRRVPLIGMTDCGSTTSSDCVLDAFFCFVSRDGAINDRAKGRLD